MPYQKPSPFKVLFSHYLIRTQFQEMDCSLETSHSVQKENHQNHQSLFWIRQNSTRYNKVQQSATINVITVVACSPSSSGASKKTPHHVEKFPTITTSRNTQRYVSSATATWTTNRSQLENGRVQPCTNVWQCEKPPLEPKCQRFVYQGVFLQVVGDRSPHF